jgi:hypothetical protein
MYNEELHKEILNVIVKAEENPAPNLGDGVFAFSCYLRKGGYKSDAKVYLSENITPAIADVLIRNIYASVYEFAHRGDKDSKELNKKLRALKGEDVDRDKEKI